MKNQRTTEEFLLSGLQSKREIKSSLQKRSNIVLQYHYQCSSKTALKEKSGYAMTTINRWLSRWSSYESARLEWYIDYQSKSIKLQEYKKLLIGIFKDSARSGKPATFDEETKEKIVSLAISNPASLGLPFTRWSEVLLQKELLNRKIVKSISTSHIGRILKKSQNTSPSE